MGVGGPSTSSDGTFSEGGEDTAYSNSNGDEDVRYSPGSRQIALSAMRMLNPFDYSAVDRVNAPVPPGSVPLHELYDAGLPSPASGSPSR